ncbi:pyridine nucleotide-disulfide oxidoreductase family protein [Burkholderia pseudomallei]|nr:pyridine nucleotide-disulfide oxidoreductase family protein [Burkholderia pseudomallei]
MTDTFARRADALARRSYYEATVRRPADDPALAEALDVDVCVIGAGFAGLSTALDCRARGLSVAVLDARRPGWGASGRNGGQLIAGFAKDGEIERQLGVEGARARHGRCRSMRSRSSTSASRATASTAISRAAI